VVKSAADHLTAGEHHVAIGFAVPTASSLDARQYAQAGVMPLRGRKLTAQAAWLRLATAARTGDPAPNGCKDAKHVSWIRSAHD
jgi:hypothetical protein